VKSLKIGIPKGSMGNSGNQEQAGKEQGWGRSSFPEFHIKNAEPIFY
jgi:hypothetical protein